MAFAPVDQHFLSLDQADWDFTGKKIRIHFEKSFISSSRF